MRLRPARATGGMPSYHELSSGADNSDDNSAAATSSHSQAQSTRNSLRQRSKTQPQTYRDPETDEDEDLNEDLDDEDLKKSRSNSLHNHRRSKASSPRNGIDLAKWNRTKTSERRSRRAVKPASYKEPDTDGDDDAEDQTSVDLERLRDRIDESAGATTPIRIRLRLRSPPPDARSTRSTTHLKEQKRQFTYRHGTLDSEDDRVLTQVLAERRGTSESLAFRASKRKSEDNSKKDNVSNSGGDRKRRKTKVGEIPTATVRNSGRSKKKRTSLRAGSESSDGFRATETEHRKAGKNGKHSIRNFISRKPSSSNLTKTSHGKHKDAPQAQIRPQAIPPWPKGLEFEILQSIFTYASEPLTHDVTGYTTASVHWLLDTSLVCREFFEPAMSVLYRSPPLLPASKAFGLSDLVSSNSQSAQNYSKWIKRLDVEAYQTLSLSNGKARGYVDITHLIRHTPQLKHINLYLFTDTPPYRQLIKQNKWRYPESMFATMDEVGIRLHSFKWNTMMVDQDRCFDLIQETHLRPSFQTIRALTFVNFGWDVTMPQAPPLPEEEEAEVKVAFSCLTDLRELTFEKCGMLNEHLLPLLPKGLERLEITNCSSVTVDALHPFLVTHGGNLKELVLNHNQSLSLSFLTDLATSCPKLEVLRINLSYFSSLHMRNTSEPGYDFLLNLDEVPTWPSSLRILEIDQMRKWDSETAAAFFFSLIDSAGNLPYLRVLVLKAILKISWRDRATFRDKWIHRLQRVFLRRNAPPRSIKPTIKSQPSTVAVEESHNIQHIPSTISTNGNASEDGAETHTRQSRRLAEVAARKDSQTNSLQNTDDSSDDDSRSTYEAEDSSSESKQKCKGKPLFIQGLCETVFIRIDDSRPTELQYNENDFLDDEVSGDEDWDGTDNFAWGGQE